MFANNSLVPSIRDLQDVLGRLEEEDALTLVVRRKQQLVTVTFPVPAKPS